MHSPSIRNLISGIGLLVSLFVALGAPAAYFAVGSAAVTEDLILKATQSAGHAVKYIFAHERMWRYQQVHLGEVIELPVDGGRPVRQRITDLGEKVVLQEEVDLAAPLRRYRVPLKIAGEVVGWLEAETSMRPLLVSTGYVAAVSCLLGLSAWLMVRLLPLRCWTKRCSACPCKAPASRPRSIT